MPRLIRRGRVEDDAFVVLRDARTYDDVPENTSVLVPLALWHSARDVLLTRGRAGVWLAPADDPAALAPDVTRLSVIAVDFPSFNDGRGFSTARLLRERYGYAGELRAIGDVQRDQLAYLAQAGFDVFAVRADRDLDDAVKALADFTDGYQSTALRTPWFRRRAAAGAAS
ncbi:MAG: DUF934 domain-containing protein [Burkholderiales bacterium]